MILVADSCGAQIPCEGPNFLLRVKLSVEFLEGKWREFENELLKQNLDPVAYFQI